MIDRESESPMKEESGTEEGSSYVPASIYTRVWAWVGIVYMVIIILLVTYFIATSTFLTGLTGIMLFPVLGGFCVVKAIQSRRLEDRTEQVVALSWSILSGVLCIITLIWGIVQVINLF